MAGMQGAFTRFEHFGKRWDERGGLNGCGVVGTEVRARKVQGNDYDQDDEKEPRMKPPARKPAHDDSYAQRRNCAEQKGQGSRVGQLASQGRRCSKEGGCPRADDVDMKAEPRD